MLAYITICRGMNVVTSWLHSSGVIKETSVNEVLDCEGGSREAFGYQERLWSACKAMGRYYSGLSPPFMNHPYFVQYAEGYRHAATSGSRRAVSGSEQKSWGGLDLEGLIENKRLSRSSASRPSVPGSI